MLLWVRSMRLFMCRSLQRIATWTTNLQLTVITSHPRQPVEFNSKPNDDDMPVVGWLGMASLVCDDGVYDNRLLKVLHVVSLLHPTLYSPLPASASICENTWAQAKWVALPAGNTRHSTVLCVATRHVQTLKLCILVDLIYMNHLQGCLCLIVIYSIKHW